MFEVYEKKIRNFLIVLFILAICMAFINLCGCDTSVGPEDLNYISIQYRESEIVGGTKIYYIGHMTYNDGEMAFIDNNPPGSGWSTGKWIKKDKDFTYNRKKFRCKTVHGDYIEIAAY